MMMADRNTMIDIKMQGPTLELSPAVSKYEDMFLAICARPFHHERTP